MERLREIERGREGRLRGMERGRETVRGNDIGNGLEM